MKNLVFLLSMILLLTGGCKYFKKQSPKSVDIISSDTSEPESSYDSTAYYEPVQPAAEVSQPVVQSTAISGKYYMIVGCFKVDANADRYAEKIRSMGYEAQIISGISDFEMVAARSYNSYRESVNDIEKFRTDVTPNAWVYRQR